MSFNHTENRDLIELSFCSLLNIISQCQYFDAPFNDTTSSIHYIKNTISLLQVNIRSLTKKQENFNALYEFFNLASIHPRHCVCIRNAIQRQPIN